MKNRPRPNPDVRSLSATTGVLTSTVLVFISTFIVHLAIPQTAFAQSAQLSGVITDPSGGRIANASVTVLNKDTGIERQADSNQDGYYAVPLLQIGKYMVTVKAAGFATQVQSSVTLDVGQQLVLNFSLKVGNIAQTVEVTEEAPTVELASSSLDAQVTSTAVRELPLNGRSWTDLALLQPGVTAIQTQVSFAVGADRGNRGFGAQASISGARPQQNNYRLDGISLNDYANGAPGSVLGGDLGVDAIEEFSVSTSNYSAEYGRTSGGVVSASTRSGTNQFHGSAYEFIRNSALDARNFFDGATIPPFRRNQFGASFGGPIRKDQTFIFGDYEGLRQSKGITSVSIVPSADARNGILHNPDGSTCTIGIPRAPGTLSPTDPGCAYTNSAGTVGVDPSVQKYLPFYPLPNRGLTPDGNGDTGVFGFAAQQVVNENYFTIRVDHRISSKHQVSGTYLYDKTPYSSPDGLDNVLLGSRTFRQVAILESADTFNPNVINSVRFGFNRAVVDNDQSIQAINPLAADPTLAAVPGRNATQVSVTGLGQFTGGVGAPATYLYRWNSFQVYDDLFVTRGTHSLKFGVAIERMQLNQLALSGPSGTFFFGSLQNFLTNTPKHFDSGFPNTLTPRGLRQSLVGLYAQDDWRLRPNLMVNLGLRYEMSTVPTEVQGKLATLINITDPTPHLGSPFFANPTLRNFEPRVGFAWDPFRDSKTAVRGGFGVFDVLPLIDEFVLLTNQAYPFYQVGTATNLKPGTFFAAAFPLLGPTSFRETYIEPKPHRNYVMQWNLNVQRAITSDLSGMIAYVGSRGVHQPFRSDDIDIVAPTLTSAGYLWPSPIGTFATINPNFGSIKGLMWGGGSEFHALEAQLTKNVAHGLHVQGSFTWGKSIDTSSTTMVGDAFSNSIASLHWFDLRLSRALSDFNITRTLVINGTWQVPERKSLSGATAFIVNGWQLGAIYKANDGVPFTATFGTDGDPLGLNSSDPWDFPNRLTGPGCTSLTNPGNPNHYIKTECFALPAAPTPAFWQANCDTVSPIYGPNGATEPYPACFNLRGNAGRNILIGPGISNLDFSVFKNNRVRHISENLNVQFRAEFFNILNRPNFAVPVTPDNVTIFDSTGVPVPGAGLLTSTSTTAREMQFALKFVW